LGVERPLPIAQTFVVFYASATIGPLLLGVSLYQAAKFGLTEGGYGFLFSLLTSYVGLFLTIYFLPATKVRIRPALLGAAVTAITFEIAKYAFSVYVANLAMAKYSGIYGALAAVPLSLIWIYWSWMMLLLGAEVAHATQHLGLLEMSDRRGTLSLENELLQRVNGPMAVRLMVRIAETYIAGGKAVTRRQLGERFDLGDEVVDRLVRRLIDRDLLLEVDGEPTGLAPGRPPDAIAVAEVLAAFRVGDGGDRGGEARSAVDRLLAEIEGVQAERTGATTLADLARPN
jgi:membrane protein